MTITAEFQDELAKILADATASGQDHVVVRAGDLHRSLGGYPRGGNRMPICCRAMRAAKDEAWGDRTISAPPKGDGASLTIRYVLPRLRAAAKRSAAVTGPEPTKEPAVSGPSGKPHVHPEFLQAVEALHAKFDQLVNMAAVKPSALPRGAPTQGIYLFSEGARPMYVGRTKRLRQRLRNHCGNGSRENQAVFAFKLAREVTGAGKARYSTEGSRAALMKDPAFAAAFKEAKQRVRRMDLRFVSEPDSLKQALLEMYVAVVLRTPYNDFDTH